MPTLYVENVPEDLYTALRERARENRKSIAAEVLTLLAENVPTAAELTRRKAWLNRARRLRSKSPTSSGPFPTTEELQREDRRR
jgi:plasmid stability protein